MQITNEFVRAIPKSELHCHLDGSIRPGTLVELAQEKKIKLPSYEIDGLKQLVFKDTYKDLNDYLKGFAYTLAVLQEPESLERVSYELAEDCFNEGVRYLEVRFAPQLHVSDRFSVEAVLKSVHSGLERFEKTANQRPEIVSGEEPEFRFGIICCAMRMFNSDFSDYFRQFSTVHQYSPSNKILSLASQELAYTVVKIRDDLGLPIVGFDLAGSEDGFPAEEHVEAFRYAHRHFLKKTVHAGEAYGPESIFQAITDLYADRIGHGFHLYSANLITDETITDTEKYISDLAQFIADRRITIEVCLTSNRQTMPNLKGWENHSFNKFLEAGLSVSLCTDNRTISNTTLTDEIMLAVTAFKLSPQKLKNIVIYGFKRSFFPGEYRVKRRYVRQIIDYYEKLEKKFSETNSKPKTFS